MRFLLYFPLPLLLILGTFVSIDSQAAPKSVFKPVSPWSTHKPRLKRSIDDSNSTADYDSLSLDELTNLLEETKKTAENEKMDLDSANSSLIAKQEEFDKATKDFDKKKEEWDRWSEQIKWKEAAEAAEKLVNETADEVQRLNGIVAGYEADLEPEYERVRVAQQNLDGLNDIDNDIITATSEATRLAGELSTEKAREPALRTAKKSTGDALTSAKRLEGTYRTNYKTQRCDDPQQAGVQPCTDTIAHWTAAKQALQSAQTASDAAESAYQAHTTSVRELDRQRRAADTLVRKLTAMKADPDGSRRRAQAVLEQATTEKDDAEKPLLEERELLREAEGRLAEAFAAKSAADEKVRDLTSDATSQASLAHAAFLDASERREELSVELGKLQAVKEEKEKTWNATNAKVAALQQRKDKKGPVSTGGMPLAAILGICIVAIVVIGGIFGGAAFAYVRKRRRLAMKQQTAVEENPAKEEVKQSVDKVASDQSKSSVKADNVPFTPAGAVVCCPDTLQLYIRGKLVSIDDSGWMEMNDDHETTMAAQQPNPAKTSALFEELPVTVLPKARDVIRKKIQNVEETKILITNDGVLFKMGKFGYMAASFDGHDSRSAFAPNDYKILYNIDDGYKILDSVLRTHSSQELRVMPDDVIPPISELFRVIFMRSEMPNISKYERMDLREERKALRKARRNRDSAGQDNLPTARQPLSEQQDQDGEKRDSAGQDDLPTARQPVSEQQDVTEKTQKSVSGTQKEAGKEEPPTAVIPDDVAVVTGTPKDESKPAESAIDESLVETTGIDDSHRELATGISGTEPPPVAGVRRRESRNRRDDKKKKGPRKRSKGAKKGFWRQVRAERRGGAKSESSTNSSSASSRRVLRLLAHRLLNDTTTASTMQKITVAEKRKLEYILTGHILDKEEINDAIEIIKQIFKEIRPEFEDKARVIELETPATVVTDQHGNLTMLLKIFQSYHRPFELAWRYHKFVFTGDYVDRGANSLQVLLVLFVLKLLYPENIILLRGNHEDPKCNIGYGFFDELDKWFGTEVLDESKRPRMVASELSNEMKGEIAEVFARMPLAARIDKKIFACHGCVPDDKGDLVERINALPNVIHDPMSIDLVRKLLWNDVALGVHGSEPNNTRGGIGEVIGADAIERSCERNGFKMIVRGHQCVSVGYESFAGGKLMLVFSSADYVKDKNHGAVIDFTKDGYGIRIFVNIDKLRRKASRSERKNAWLRIHSRDWDLSFLKTSAHNKALEKSKSKEASQGEQAHKKKAKKKQDENVKKKAPQLEQADKKIEEKTTEFTVTMAPK